MLQVAARLSTVKLRSADPAGQAARYLGSGKGKEEVLSGL